MKTPILSCLFVLTLLLPCRSANAVQAIDQFQMKDQNRWNCARSIAVSLFPVTGEFKGIKPVDYYQNDFARKLAAGLGKLPGIEKVAVVTEKSPVPADILLDGRFIDLTTGSRAMRFWVGFGAGKSFCRVAITAVDPAGMSEVFTLDHARGSAMDIVNEDELIENIDEVVEDLVAGLSAVRGVCKKEPLQDATPKTSP